jgi:hypothetical protein
MRPASHPKPKANTTPPTIPRLVEQIVIIQGRTHFTLTSIGVMRADRVHLIHLSTNRSVGLVCHGLETGSLFNIILTFIHLRQNALSTINEFAPLHVFK